MANNQALTPRLTVAIPLYKATPWHENIVHNIQRIPDNTIILLSDEVSSDDSAQQIANQFKDDPRIRVRMRNGQPGWREHCNALIQECETEFFSLLPQDDLIEADYYQKLVSGLDNNPKMGLSFGDLIAEGGHYTQPTQLPPPPFQLGSFEPWMEAIELDFHWNLGIPFRGVIRRTILRSIPATPGDHFADQIWVFGMALSAHLLLVPDAKYHKRYYAENTHGQWQIPTSMNRKQQLIAEIRSVLGGHENAKRAISHLEHKFEERLLFQWYKLGFF